MGEFATGEKCCKCGDDADLGFLAHHKPPRRPYCLPCLERDYPEIKDDIPRLRKAAVKLRKRLEAN